MCSLKRAFGAREIKTDKCHLGAAVVHGRERLVSFLAGCVPYFQLDGFSIAGVFFGNESRSDGIGQMRIKGVGDETVDQRGFPDRRIAQKHDFVRGRHAEEDYTDKMLVDKI